MRIVKFTYEKGGQSYVGFAGSFEEARRLAKGDWREDDHRWRRNIKYEEVVYKFDPCAKNVLEIIQVAMTEAKQASGICKRELQYSHEHDPISTKLGGGQAERISLGGQIG